MWTGLPEVVRWIWPTIFVIWAISGLTMKATVGSKDGARARLSLWVVLGGWFLLFSANFRPGLLAERFVPFGPAAAYTGFALTVVGLGFALWAVFAIGRNWGRLVTVQEGHQIVRTGPYAIVRHPIYSGFMLATLGTASVFDEVAWIGCHFAGGNLLGLQIQARRTLNDRTVRGGVRRLSPPC